MLRTPRGRKREEVVLYCMLLNDVQTVLNCEEIDPIVRLEPSLAT